MKTETIPWKKEGHIHHAHHELEIEGISVSYGSIRALDNIHFQTCCGRSLALVGPNGAGKSTLLKVLAGLIRSRGEILWRGRALATTTREIAYLPQREDIDWNYPITVRGLVEMGRYPHVGWWKPYHKENHAVVEYALAAMQLEDLQKRQISELSGGQQQRTFIARALAQESHVLLLDEPFNGLDKPARNNLAALFKELTHEGRLIIASHHDLHTVQEIFDEILLLDGEQIAFGSIETVFTEENIAKTYKEKFQLEK